MNNMIDPRNCKKFRMKDVCPNRDKKLLVYLDNQVISDLNIAFASSAEEYLSRVESTGETLLSLISIRNALLKNAGTIEEQRQLLLQGKEKEDIPFLSTLRILSSGREGSQIEDGLSGAVITYTSDTISTIKENARTALDRKEKSVQHRVGDF